MLSFSLSLSLNESESPCWHASYTLSDIAYCVCSTHVVPSPTGSSSSSNTTEKRKGLDAEYKANSRIEQSRGRKAAKPHECGLMLQMPVGEGTT